MSTATACTSQRPRNLAIALVACALAVAGSSLLPDGPDPVSAAPVRSRTTPTGAPPGAAPACQAACGLQSGGGAKLVAELPDKVPDPDAGRLDVPRVGPEIRLSTRTCARSRAPGTATSSAACRTWVKSGPVNIVIAYGSTDPYRLLTRGAHAAWRRAMGNHLVAAGYLEDRSAGCRTGWTDSREQAELRLNRTDRRHLKLFHASCTQRGLHVVFADAHTDRFDRRRCGGDRMTDLDAARDAVVRTLSGLPGVSVEYRQDGPAGAVYPGGCGQAVVSDGRVAYITIS